MVAINREVRRYIADTIKLNRGAVTHALSSSGATLTRKIIEDLDLPEGYVDVLYKALDDRQLETVDCVPTSTPMVDAVLPVILLLGHYIHGEGTLQGPDFIDYGGKIGIMSALTALKLYEMKGSAQAAKDADERMPYNEFAQSVRSVLVPLMRKKSIRQLLGDLTESFQTRVPRQISNLMDRAGLLDEHMKAKDVDVLIKCTYMFSSRANLLAFMRSPLTVVCNFGGVLGLYTIALQRLGVQLETSEKANIEKANQLAQQQATIDSLRARAAENSKQIAQARNDGRGSAEERIRQLERQVQQLQSSNKSLSAKLKESKQRTADLQAAAALQSEVAQAEDLLDLPETGVLVVGGHTNLQNKLRQAHPGWIIVEDGSKAFDPGAPVVVFYMCSHALHSQGDRLFSYVDKSRVLFVPFGTNIALLDRTMQYLYTKWKRK